jgi:BirA family biotin operon repressor/biotin-[acetyl-CoA-carboxylase] ligase
MEAQIAAARTVAALTGKEARLRWPNDVYAEGKKIAGVLTELSAEGDRLRWIALGVGINVNNPAPVFGTRTGTVSCAGIAGRRLSRREGLGMFLGELEKLRGAGAGELRDAWNSLADGIGAPVTALSPERGEEGAPPELRARGYFTGLDSRGRCGLKVGTDTRFYDPGTVSLVYGEGNP